MTIELNDTASIDWIRVRRDQDTGIESLHAHFRGHAYDASALQAAFGQSPHAYLMRLLLRTARALLAGGMTPSKVAVEAGFPTRAIWAPGSVAPTG